MVFNATFNNISVLLVEETGLPQKKTQICRKVLIVRRMEGSWDAFVNYFIPSRKYKLGVDTETNRKCGDSPFTPSYLLMTYFVSTQAGNILHQYIFCIYQHIWKLSLHRKMTTQLWTEHDWYTLQCVVPFLGFPPNQGVLRYTCLDLPGVWKACFIMFNMYLSTHCLHLCNKLISLWNFLQSFEVAL